MSSTTTSRNRSLLLLLFFFFLQNFDSSAQENVQLTGFNCTFISTDGVSAFPCATKVTATITLPNNNLVTSVNLIFPNSFCVYGISAEGGGNPNFTNLGQTSIGNITVPDGQLMNLAISPTAQPIIVEFEYKNFNVYNANGQVNTNFLLFDCSGTGNNITYLSNLNGSNLQTIPDDWGFVQLNHNSNALISLVHGSMGNESMNPGESYIRTFFVDIFSLSVDEFWLTITDEVDAILSNTVIYKDGQVNLPLIYDSGTPANVFNFQNYIVPGPNGARRLQFSQTVILVCNNNNPQITTVKAGLTCYCNSANSSVNFYTPITLNGTAGVMPNLSIEGQSFTSNVAENECTTFTLEIPFTVTGSALYASLENIHIPLSQIWAQNISSIAVIAGEYSTSINSNYTSDNGGLSIVFSTLSSTLQGFQPSINSTTGQWFNSSFKLQIVFNNPLTSSSSSCNGLPALQLYANNTLSLNLRSSCSTSIQNTYSLNPVTAHVTPVVLTTTNSDTDLAYYSENDQYANLVFDVYNLTTMPITMYSNSNPQPLCGNIDYSLVVEIAEFGVPLTLDFISELSINNVSVANATIENGNLIVPLSTLSASNEPNLQKVKFKLQYSGVCPDGTEDNNFGSYIIKAQIRAECPDCDNATLILKCAEHELFVHCPGTCETAVHIDKNIQARRITLGFEGLSQFNQNNPLTELSGNLNEDEKKNELTKVYPFDLVEIITQGEVYHQNTNDNSLYSMTQVGFELSVSDVFGNGDNDFLNIHQVNAVFTNLQNQSLIFTLPENAYSFIGWQSEAVPGISQSMKIGRLFFTLPSEISLSEDSWKIDLILVLRVGALPELAPNYYPVSFRCQYIATKLGGGYHTSCDPYGFNLMVLKTAVISANSSVAIVAPDNPNNRSFVLPHILGNAIDNLPALSSCEADGVVGYRIIGGFNGAISDFEHEFRPVIGWPNSGYIEGLAEVKGIYSDQSEFVLQSEPGNFARTSNPAIQDARANILGTQGYQGFYYKINKPCAFGNSNSTVPLNVTLDINAHAYIHDGFQLSALPPALPAPNLAYVPNMNNLDWNPNFNSTYNIPNFENPIAQNGTFNFNLKMPAGLGNKPMFLFFSISDFVGNSPPTIGTPTIAGFELHSSITNLFISNEGISDVDYTSFSIPINVNCFPSAFNINVAWGISCDPDYNFFSIANIGEILPLPGITTTCPNNFATRSFRFKHVNNPFAETNNLVADNETCELVWTLNFTNPINNSPAVFNEFNLNFFTGLLYTEAVVSYTEPGNSNPNQPTLNPPAFNVTLPGGSITTQPLVYTTLSLNPSEFTIAPGATISYVLRFKLSEDVCANFNDYLPNNFLSFFSWQTDCQPPTNGPITEITKPVLLDMVSQIIDQVANPDCCVPVPITYELKPNCNASEVPFNGELTLSMALPCTTEYQYTLISNIDNETFEVAQGNLGGINPCSSTIINLAHGTYGLIYFNSEAGWYFVQTITIGDIQLVATFQESSISFCQGESISLAPIIQTNSNTSSLSYQWLLNGEAIQNQTTATLENPSQSGNYFFTVSNGTCVATADIMVTVNPLPVISPAGSITFCESGTLSVSDGTAPYTWSNSQTGVNLTVNASGTFNVTDANGCSATANITVTVNPLPDASIAANGPTTFCQGGSVVLTASGGDNFQWSNGETTPNITVTSSGIYFVSVSHNGCSTHSVSISIQVISNEICNCLNTCNLNNSFIIPENINTSTELSALLNSNIILDVCLIIQNDLLINNDFTFSNCVVTVLAGKEISVENVTGRLSLINNTIVKGCNKMWKGINNAGELNISNSEIRDAQIGVLANRQPNSRTNLFFAIFKNNFIGLKNSEIGQNHQVNFKHVLFEGGTLLPMYDNQYPEHQNHSLAGIIAVENFLLNVTTGTRFVNLCNGIIAHNSIIKIYRPDMENINLFNTSYSGNLYWLADQILGLPNSTNQTPVNGNAIYATAFSVLYVTGPANEGLPSSFTNFNNCVNGIVCNQSAMILKNTKFDNVTNGVRLSNMAGQAYQITNNTLYTRFNGIRLLHNDGANPSVIAFNRLFSVYPFSQFPNVNINTGIVVASFASASNIRIFENDIEALQGITLTNAEKIFLKNNRVKITPFINIPLLPNFDVGAGISLANTPNAILECNEVEGNAINKQRAFNFQLSPNSFTFNNTTKNSRIGFVFQGDCHAMMFEKNTINSHSIGLEITATGVLGTIVNGQNKWTGNYTIASARRMSNLTLASLNSFTVKVPASPVFYPLMTLSPLNSFCEGNFFFCDQGLPDPSDPECFPMVNIFSNGIAENNINTKFEIAEGLANQTISFEAYNQSLLSQLTRSIEADVATGALVLPDTGFFIPFKQTLQLSNERRFNQADHVLTKPLNDSSQTLLFNSKLQELNAWIYHVEAIDSLLNAQPGWTDSLSLERLLAVGQLNTLKQQLALIASESFHKQGLNKDSAFVYSQGIVWQHDFENYERQVNQIYLQSNATGIGLNFTESQVGELQYLAHLCPALGGKAVFKARALLALVNDTAFYNDDDLCLSQGVLYRNSQFETQAAKTDRFKVYPNPTSSMITIYDTIENETKIIEIFNSLGQLLGRYQSLDNFTQLTLPFNQISQGIYCIRILDSSSSMIHQQLIIKQ